MKPYFGNRPIMQWIELGRYEQIEEPNPFILFHRKDEIHWVKGIEVF